MGKKNINIQSSSRAWLVSKTIASLPLGPMIFSGMFDHVYSPGHDIPLVEQAWKLVRKQLVTTTAFTPLLRQQDHLVMQVSAVACWVQCWMKPLMSSSSRSQNHPTRHRPLPLLLITHHNKAIKPYCWRHPLLWMQDIKKATSTDRETLPAG